MSQGYTLLVVGAGGIGRATSDLVAVRPSTDERHAILAALWMLESIATALPKNDERVRIIIAAAGSHHQRYGFFGATL
jgi:hypothetical protein